MAEQKLREREIACKKQHKRQRQENGEEEEDFQIDEDLNKNGGESTSSVAPSEEPITWEWLDGWREKLLKPLLQSHQTHSQTGPGKFKRMRFF